MGVGYAGSTIQLAAKLPVGAVEPALAERQLWVDAVEKLTCHSRFWVGAVGSAQFHFRSIRGSWPDNPQEPPLTASTQVPDQTAGLVVGGPWS
jgi:hypothetical protein